MRKVTRKTLDILYGLLPLAGLVILAFVGYYAKVAIDKHNQSLYSRYQNFSKLVIDIPLHIEYTIAGGGYTVHTIEGVRVTAYNNLPEQTSSTPNIGASNRKVYEGSVAVSRDLIREFNIKYGDKICLFKTEKCYIIEDTMNKRYDNRINPGNGHRVDIFMYSKEKALKVNFKTDMLLIKQR